MMKLLLGLAVITLGYHLAVVQAAVSAEDHCRCCFQLADRFEELVTEEVSKPQYARQQGTRLDGEGRPMFPKNVGESIFYKILEEACTGNTNGTACYDLLDQYEQTIRRWFFEERQSKKFVDAVCLGAIPRCTNEAGRSTNGDEVEEDEAAKDEELVSEDESVSEEESTSKEKRASATNIHRQAEHLKAEAEKLVHRAEEKVGKTFKRAEEKVKRIMDTSNIVDTLKQVEKTFMGKMDAVIGEIRSYSQQVTDAARSQGAAVAANARRLGQHVTERFLGRKETPTERVTHWICDHHWYLVAFFVTLVLAIPVAWYLKCRCCRTSKPALPARSRSRTKQPRGAAAGARRTHRVTSDEE